jgi:hypothetical protein
LGCRTGVGASSGVVSIIAGGGLETPVFWAIAGAAAARANRAVERAIFMGDNL